MRSVTDGSASQHSGRQSTTCYVMRLPVDRRITSGSCPQSGNHLPSLLKSKVQYHETTSVFSEIGWDFFTNSRSRLKSSRSRTNLRFMCWGLRSRVTFWNYCKWVELHRLFVYLEVPECNRRTDSRLEMSRYLWLAVHIASITFSRPCAHFNTIRVW